MPFLRLFLQHEIKRIDWQILIFFSKGRYVSSLSCITRLQTKRRMNDWKSKLKFCHPDSSLLESAFHWSVHWEELSERHLAWGNKKSSACLYYALQDPVFWIYLLIVLEVINYFLQYWDCLICWKWKRWKYAVTMALEAWNLKQSSCLFL